MIFLFSSAPINDTDFEGGDEETGIEWSDDDEDVEDDQDWDMICPELGTVLREFGITRDNYVVRISITETNNTNINNSDNNNNNNNNNN